MHKRRYTLFFQKANVRWSFSLLKTAPFHLTMRLTKVLVEYIIDSTLLIFF